VVTVLARLLARGFFRTIEVTGERDLEGPVIVAASHLNGFVDPVLLVRTVGCLPRFLAKGTLWKVAPARPFLAFARIIPVHRPEDKEAKASNVGTFDTAVEALRAGDLVGIFPEGTTHDRPHLVRLRTGVARIALQAVDDGVEHVRIVPVGIAYEDKVTLRGRALVDVGEPIDVAPQVAALRARSLDDHDVVDGLMAVLDAQLRGVSPDFESMEERLALSGAAKVVVRDRMDDPQRPVPLSDSSPIARELAHRPERERQAVGDAMARYQLVLTDTDLRDEDVVRSVSSRALGTRVALLALLFVVLAPFAAAGFVANIVPVVLVIVAGLVPGAPVTKGTIRLLVGAIVFPLTWLLIAWRGSATDLLAKVASAASFPFLPFWDPGQDRSGFWRSLLVFLAIPLFGLAAMVLVEEWRELRRAWQSWRTVLDRRGQLAELRELRAIVVDEVDRIDVLPAPSEPAEADPDEVATELLP
jgi:1-acyl-sn-glycerol-3-phosphate acyltransferase